jgi:hypothetical protein
VTAPFKIDSPNTHTHTHTHTHTRVPARVHTQKTHPARRTPQRARQRCWRVFLVCWRVFPSFAAPAPAHESAGAPLSAPSERNNPEHGEKRESSRRCLHFLIGLHTRMWSMCLYFVIGLHTRMWSMCLHFLIGILTRTWFRV